MEPRRHLLVPLLALSMVLTAAAWVNAQDRGDQRSGGTSVSLQVNFGSRPHWVPVEGTRVQAIRQGDRTDYDMFRYGRYFYAYNHANDQWYRSRTWRGRFVWVDSRYLPSELRRVPRQHWRNYPASWEDRRHQGGGSATLSITFQSRPHWTGVPGTRVEVIPAPERPAYDVFRYGGTYYAYDNDRWYSSNRESGNFIMIDERSVPSELTRVPREHWRHYPSAWQDQGQRGTPPGLEKKGGNPPGQEKKNRGR